jgi:hypothetical protein
MHSISFIGNDAPLEFTFPASWDEAQPHMLLPIVKAQLVHATLAQKPKHEQQVANMHLRKLLLQELAAVPQAITEAITDVEDLLFEVDTTNYRGPYRPVKTSEWRILPQLDWAFTPPSYHKSLLHRVEHNGLVWIGPDDHFDAMALNQWLWAANLNKAFKAFEGEKRVDYFHRHLACLYTPEGTTWTNLTIEAHAALIAAWPEDLKLAAMLNYEAIQSTLPSLYKRVYDPSGDAAQSPMGVFGLAYDVAQSGVFGTKDQVELVRVHEVLAYMEHTLFKDEQAEKKAKRNAMKK